MPGSFLALYHLEKFDGETEDDGNDSRECHTAKRDRAECDAGVADADAEYDGSQDKVDRFVVIDFRFDEHADAACRDNAEEKERYTAHNGCRDTLDSGSKFADEREDDGKCRGTTDDPYAEYFGDGEDADVFTVGCIRCRAEEAREHRRETVTEERAVKAGIFRQVFVYDIACYDQVADMFDDYDECGRQDDGDRTEIERRCVDRRHCEPRGILHRCQVDHAHEEGECITADNTDEDRNDSEESAEGDRADDRHDKREYRYDDSVHIDRLRVETCHACGRRHQFKSDNGNDSAHCGGRKYDIYPSSTDIAY